MQTKDLETKLIGDHGISFKVPKNQKYGIVLNDLINDLSIFYKLQSIDEEPKKNKILDLKQYDSYDFNLNNNLYLNLYTKDGKNNFNYGCLGFKLVEKNEKENQKVYDSQIHEYVNKNVNLKNKYIQVYFNFSKQLEKKIGTENAKELMFRDRENFLNFLDKIKTPGEFYFNHYLRLKK